MRNRTHDITMASPSGVAANAATCIEIQGKNGATPSKEEAAAPLDSPSAPAYLCCSPEDPDEFQVDLCPRKWFCCCSNDGSGSGPGGRQRRRLGFLQIVWRICFVILCLPLCYPCYLSRRCRRRRRRLDGVVVSSPTSPCSNRVATCPSPEHVIVANKIPKQPQSEETKI